MKLSKAQKILLITAAFLLAFISCISTYLIHSNDLSNQHIRAYDVTEAYGEELQDDFQSAIDKSSLLDQEIAANHGNIDYFEESAKLLMTDNVAMIELAPGGIITNTYPSSDSQIGMDLNKDAGALNVMQYARENNEPVLYGPFTIDTAGECVCITNPVFLSGDKQFWGYVIIAVKVPDVYSSTLEALNTLGYNYSLQTTMSPLQSNNVEVSTSLTDGKQLDNPASYTFSIGACSWTLQVEPLKGWKSSRAVPFCVFTVLCCIAFEGLLYLTLHTKQQDKRLHTLAYQDALTGLLSRGGFIKQLDEASANPFVHTYTLVFLDLDDFKVINDVYGHAAGDKALKHLAFYLRSSFPEDSLIGRTGGDEFCVVIWNHTPEESAEMVIKAIASEQVFEINGKTIRYTISAGYADAPQQAQQRSALMIMADEALYAAKISGKHEARHYDPSMADIKREQLGFSTKALASGIPGSFLIYKSDPNDEEILFANDSLIHLVGCDNYDDFCSFTGGKFTHIIVPEDRSRVEASIWEQINHQKETETEKKPYYEDYVEYSIITKDGRVIPVIDVGRLVEDSSYGGVFFVFIYEKAAMDEDFLKRAY
ncbi:MAG: diguanylate cyclase [Lactimicrobium sp.]|jgi:diguanylate cyclase (GGDEF)-like protein|uniref:sensor domain-containing diguanylate cyclase n=1 Tax=Lactimicrobium sp. TaxID=2563780 RepID=UPI002F35CC7B